MPVGEEISGRLRHVGSTRSTALEVWEAPKRHAAAAEHASIGEGAGNKHMEASVG